VKIRAVVHAVVIAWALLGCATVCAAVVPVDVQMALFVKIWKLDRNFKTAPVTVVAVLYQESVLESVEARTAVVAWTQSAANIRVVAIALDRVSLDEALSNVAVDVFYVAPLRGVDIRQIARIAQKRQIRTITGVPDYAREGISVALGVRNDRPLVIINLEASRAEGAAFQAQLLQLAELVTTR
jgi:hypothetical protein